MFDGSKCYLLLCDNFSVQQCIWLLRYWGKGGQVNNKLIKASWHLIMFRMETVTLQVLISLPQYKCNEAKHTFIGSTNANVMKWNVITSNYRTICLDFGLFCQAEFLKCLIFSLYGGFMYIKDPRLSFIKFYNTESEAMVWKKSTKPLNIQRFF